MWSPDGEHVAYTHDDAIFVAPADGGEPRRVFDAAHSSWVSWSPDGSRLAFTTGNRGYIDALNIARSDLWVVSSRGGDPVPITDNDSLDFAPVWTPDGESLLFVSDRGGGRDIWRVDVASPDEPERLTTGLDVHTITLSQDGGKLAYAVVTVRQNLWSIPIPRGVDPNTGSTNVCRVHWTFSIMSNTLDILPSVE